MESQRGTPSIFYSFEKQFDQFCYEVYGLTYDGDALYDDNVVWWEEDMMI